MRTIADLRLCASPHHLSQGHFSNCMSDMAYETHVITVLLLHRKPKSLSKLSNWYLAHAVAYKFRRLDHDHAVNPTLLLAGEALCCLNISSFLLKSADSCFLKLAA